PPPARNRGPAAGAATGPGRPAGTACPLIALAPGPPPGRPREAPPSPGPPPVPGAEGPNLGRAPDGPGAGARRSDPVLELAGPQLLAEPVLLDLARRGAGQVEIGR